MKKGLSAIMGLLVVFGGFISLAHAETPSLKAKAMATYRDEKAQLQEINDESVTKQKEFMNNIAKVRANYTFAQKRDFVVGTYKDAYTFFVKQHDDFTLALTKAKANGVDITEAKAHFEKAWSILQATQADIDAVQKLDLKDTTSRTQAKATATKIENAYKSARQEMRDGAKALREAYLVRIKASASTGTPIVPINSNVGSVDSEE